MKIFNYLLIGTLLLAGFSACTKDPGNNGEEGEKDGNFQDVADLLASHKGLAVPSFGMVDHLEKEKPTDSEVSNVHHSLPNPYDNDAESIPVSTGGLRATGGFSYRDHRQAQICRIQLIQKSS